MARGRKAKLHMVDGKQYTIAQLAERFGVSPSAIRMRMRAIGGTAADAAQYYTEADKDSACGDTKESFTEAPNANL